MILQKLNNKYKQRVSVSVNSVILLIVIIFFLANLPIGTCIYRLLSTDFKMF